MPSWEAEDSISAVSFTGKPVSEASMVMSKTMPAHEATESTCRVFSSMDSIPAANSSMTSSSASSFLIRAMSHTHAPVSASRLKMLPARMVLTKRLMNDGLPRVFSLITAASSSSLWSTVCSMSDIMVFIVSWSSGRRSMETAGNQGLVMDAVLIRTSLLSPAADSLKAQTSMQQWRSASDVSVSIRAMDSGSALCSPSIKITRGCSWDDIARIRRWKIMPKIFFISPGPNSGISGSLPMSISSSGTMSAIILPFAPSAASILFFHLTRFSADSIISILMNSLTAMRIAL